MQPAAYAASLALDTPAEPRPPRIMHSAPAPHPRSPLHDTGRLHLAYSSGGAGVANRLGRQEHSTARRGADPGTSTSNSGRSDGGRGGTGLLGRLTNMLLTGAAAAAVAVVAQHAGPTVVQKGHEVARSLQGTQAAVASKWHDHQRRREEQREQQRRKQQQRQQEEQKQKQAAALAGQPATPATFRAMADLPPSPPRQQAASPAGPTPGPAQRSRADLPMPVPMPVPRPVPRPVPNGPAGGPRAATALPQWERQQQAQQAAAAAAAAAVAAQQRGSGGRGAAPRGPAAALLGSGAGSQGTTGNQGGFQPPLPPHMIGAARSAPSPGSAAGSSLGTPQRGPLPPPRGRYPQAGQLFPAMPPPDVSASMG